MRAITREWSPADAPEAEDAPRSVRVHESRARVHSSDPATKGLLMAYKLLDMVQARWRRLDGAHLLPLVRPGVGFVDGVQTEGRPASRRPRRRDHRAIRSRLARHALSESVCEE